MNYYYVRASTIGGRGDLVKAKDAEDAALRQAKKYPGVLHWFVWEVVNDAPLTFTPDTEIAVTGIRRSD